MSFRWIAGFGLAIERLLVTNKVVGNTPYTPSRVAAKKGNIIVSQAEEGEEMASVQRHSIVSLAVATVAVVVLWGAGSAQAAVITNGDFESATAETHAPYGGSVTAFGWVLATNAGFHEDHPRGGPGWTLDLESSGNLNTDPTISQTVGGFAVGQSYTLSWDLKLAFNWGNTYGNGPSFGVFLDNQTFGDALVLGGTLSTSYISQSVDFTATQPSHTLFFAGELDSRTNGAGRTDVSYWIDNIALSGQQAAPIPEPASLAVFGVLFGMGAAGLVVSRRRKKCV